MKLLNDYFRIDSRKVEGDDTIFGITLIPDYGAYLGHFPGKPVSPGVCAIQMIRECAELIAGKRLFLGYISQCKWSAVMTPQTTPQAQLRLRLHEAEDILKINADVFDCTTTYVAFKGEMKQVI